MGHGHPHHHDHDHGHDHAAVSAGDNPALDLSVPDEELSPTGRDIVPGGPPAPR